MLSLHQGNDLLMELGAGVTFEPITYSESNIFAVEGRKYIGKMSFKIESGSVIRPINTLPMEDYLKGVLPKEIGSSWEIEAQKAQAVAARTYLVSNMNSKPIVDTTDFQVYGGYEWHTNPTKGVQDTSDEILMFNNKPIGAYYSSENGGHTESVHEVWGGASQPYLKAKVDPHDPANSSKYLVSETALIGVLAAMQEGKRFYQ